MNLDVSGKNVDCKTHLTIHNWLYWVPLWYTKDITSLTVHCLECQWQRCFCKTKIFKSLKGKFWLGFYSCASNITSAWSIFVPHSMEIEGDMSMVLSLHVFLRPSTFEVSVHLQTSQRLDWVQIWWMKSLWENSTQISCCSLTAKFSTFSSPWLVMQCPHIWRQTSDWINALFSLPSQSDICMCNRKFYPWQIKFLVDKLLIYAPHIVNAMAANGLVMQRPRTSTAM